MSVTSEFVSDYKPPVVPRRTRIDSSHVVDDSEGNQSLPTEARDSSSNARPEVPDESRATSPALLEVEEPSPDLVAAVAGLTLDSRREQLQMQVSQLATHLQERLRETDRREAALNARASQLEADLRTSRLWLREREHEFQEREAELRRQIEDLQDRAAAPSVEAAGNALRGIPDEAEATDFNARQQAVSEREQELQLRENDLRDRRFEVERQASALRHAQQVWEQERAREERNLAQQRERLDIEYKVRCEQRDEDLRSAEALLAAHAAQIDHDRLALAAERQAWDEQKSRQSQAIDERRQASEAEHDDRRQRLDARQDWIERQKAGLEQVRGEILGLHRQSLEMRLIAEQLWSQITGRLTPADVTHAVAQLRLKLTEQYKLEEQNLEARRQELVALGERIAAQHGELKLLQSGIRDWAASRQQEIEQQAAALVQRELTLDEQELQSRQAQHQWQADRRALEQQIRDLSGKLRLSQAGT